jgi:hypothetical protein
MTTVEMIRWNQYKVSVPTRCEDERCDEARVDVYVAWCEIAPTRQCPAEEGWDADAPNLCPVCEAELDAEAIEQAAISAVVDYDEGLRDQHDEARMEAQREGD